MSKTLFPARTRQWTGAALLVVISSPSGGGKTTVIRRLRQKHPEFLYSVSATTRERRPGERQGTHYNFVTVKEFERMIRSRSLVEWAHVHQDYYGTPRANILCAKKMKRIMLFDLDVQGAASMRECEPTMVSIFLLPPSWSVLKKRLEERGSENAAQRRIRLQTARGELERRTEYKYWVTNDRLAACVSDCETIIRAEFLRQMRKAWDRKNRTSRRVDTAVMK